MSAQNWPTLSAQSVSKLPPLPKTFYSRGTLTVARELLGKGLLVQTKQNTLLVELVEVEAYLHDDPASHSYRGETKRNWVMFEAGGICYVYLSYGLNYCMNVSTGKAGSGEAILFRAAAPILGTSTLLANRGMDPSDTPSKKQLKNLLSGPGKMTQALGIDLNQNGQSFFDSAIRIVDLGRSYGETALARSPRIGISKAKDKLFRFFIKDSPWLSRRL